MGRSPGQGEPGTRGVGRPGERKGGHTRSKGTWPEGDRMGRDLGDGPQGPGGERSTETGLRGARAAALGKDIAAEGRPPR